MRVITKTTPRNFIESDTVTTGHTIILIHPDRYEYGIVTSESYQGRLTVRSLDSGFTYGDGWGEVDSIEELIETFTERGWEIHAFDTMLDAMRFYIELKG